MKSLLSAKLAEGNLRIIDSEAIEEGKTKLLKTVHLIMNILLVFG